MALGHASGLAVVMAIRDKSSVQAIDVQALRKKLKEQNAVIELAELANLIRSSKLPGIVMDDKAAELIGDWSGSTYGNPVDASSRHDNNTGKGEKTVIYRLQVPADGSYEVRVSYANAPNRASNVPVTIEHANGRKTVLVNQKQEPPLEKAFASLGTFSFNKDKPAVISISNKDTNGIVGADAVQLLKK